MVVQRYDLSRGRVYTHVSRAFHSVACSLKVVRFCLHKKDGATAEAVPSWSYRYIGLLNQNLEFLT